jgi:hypothetical protein
MFTREYVAKMGAAVGALDLCSFAVGVGESLYCAGDFFVEAWPAAVCFEFAFGTVEFGAATFTDIGAFVPECIVFAGERHLCAFVDYDLFLFWGKFLIIRLGGS